MYQISNSLRYIASKDEKEFMRYLKPVYRPAIKDQVEDALLTLEEKWGGKYSVVIES